MQHIMLLALIQAPQPIKFTTIYQKAITDSTTLVVAAGENDEGEDRHRSGFQVSIIGRDGAKRSVGSVTDRGWLEYRVLRADDSSLVVARFGTYMSQATVKLFLHPQKQYVIKQIDYAPDLGLLAVDDREVAGVLDVSPAQVKQLEERQPDLNAAEPDSTRLPRPLQDHPMPQSSYPEFARARRREVENGFDEKSTMLKEAPGPIQVVGSRIWFGKVFYDGEGLTGVGGLGYFDTSTSQYTFVPVPMMAEWSTSAILVESEAVWAGLVGYPEGEAYAGGLIRYDLKRGRTRKFPIEEVISRILRLNGRLYVVTKNGAYQLRGDTLIRYRVEPDISNRFIIVSGTVPFTQGKAPSR